MKYLMLAAEVPDDHLDEFVENLSGITLHEPQVGNSAISVASVEGADDDAWANACEVVDGWTNALGAIR